MLPFFSYYKNYVLFLIFLLTLFAPRVLPADHQNTVMWQNFVRFVDAQKGNQVSRISELKTYFQRFGYLSTDPTKNLTDLYDDELEYAVSAYQKNMGLSATGKLDTDTMNQILTPRCGVSDETSHTPTPTSSHNANNKLHARSNYAFFKNEPSWARPSPMTLTYAFLQEHMTDSMSLEDIKSAFERSFARWSSVIPVNFTEVDNYWFADIKIGFYVWDHGDGVPFDGLLGVLAHSFAPESGRLHLDGAETWTVDFNKEKSQLAVDLESVAIHEIGHVLGLAHTPIKEAIMYPSISPRTKKLDLHIDDVAGIQALYGSNPNFRHGYYVYDSSSLSTLIKMRRSLGWNMMMVIIIFLSL